MTQAGQDAFAINYGTGGIGAEIYANRIGVGPMGDCVDCKFEEFFLSAWSVGDPAMLVDRPANSMKQPPPPPSPAQPPLPPPPPLCTTAQLGDTPPRHHPIRIARTQDNLTPLMNLIRSLHCLKRRERITQMIRPMSITATSTITSNSGFFTEEGT